MRLLGGVRAKLATLVLAMILLVLTVGVAGVAGVVVATRTVDELTDRLGPATAANAGVLQDLTDAETSIRGWAITGDTSNLQTYHEAMQRLPVHERTLDGLTAGDPALRRLVASQRTAVQDWLDGYARVRTGLPAGPDTFRADLYATGKARFATIRQVNEQIAAQFDVRTARARETAARQLSLTVGVVGLVTLVGAAVALLFGRFNAAQISEPLVDLQRVVDRLASGDPTARAEASGPREVRKVAHALNNFADENARVRELEQQVVERLTDLDRAKSDFLSNVSHELRTPLTSIAGYVELFEDEFIGGLSPGQTAMLSVVNRNVARLRTLIEDLLTLSKAESDAFRTAFDVLDLNHLASDVAHDLHALAEQRGVAVHVVHPERPMLMHGDANQLSRALLNLVSNGLKFSRKGDAVTVRVKQDGECALVEVSDHGIGIPAPEMPRLATRFFRASNAVDAEITGTGLGLRIVSAIVSNHAGRLEMESVEGEGTTARMVLPLSADAAAARGHGPSTYVLLAGEETSLVHG